MISHCDLQSSSEENQIESIDEDLTSLMPMQAVRGTNMSPPQQIVTNTAKVAPSKAEPTASSKFSRYYFICYGKSEISVDRQQ